MARRALILTLLATTGAIGLVASCSNEDTSGVADAGPEAGSFTCGGEARATEPIHPAGLPTGACSAGATCDVIVRPADCSCAQDPGPAFPWQCRCISGTWSCKLQPPDGRVCGCPAGDAGAFDAPTYSTEDFSSFRYSFYGTGISGNFDMDRDCGIDAKGTLGFSSPSALPTGSGVVARDDCSAFKALAVSREVLQGYARAEAARQCAFVTDDYVTSSVATADGKSYAVSNVSGCSDSEPFVKLRIAMTRLANMYITPADAGTD